MSKNLIIALAAVLIFSSCAGVIGFRNPDVSKSEAVREEAAKDLPPVKFDDFEKGKLTGAYAYANKAGGASASYNITSPGEGHESQYAAVADYDTGSNSDWGCGFGSSTNYGEGFIDAGGRRKISLWVKAEEGLTFYIFVNESSANGADGEFWNSPSQTGAGEWAEYIIPFDEFFRNIYSGNQAGNLEFDAEGIGVVGAQIGGAQGKGKFYMDDIWIK